MKQFKDKHKGERCFILGNGPSLNDVDFELLKDEVVFGTNGIFYNDYRFTPTYYVAVNPLILEQFDSEIRMLETVKFISNSASTDALRKAWSPMPFVLDTTERTPGFQVDAEKPMWEGYTVTYVCLQLAYYMGFKEVILLGLDHYYGETGTPNTEQVFEGVDEHHFRSDYFTGKKWHTPDLPMTEIAYSFARQAFEADGRRIINCSSKTACNVFETMPLNYAYSRRVNPLVSAIVSAYKAEDFIAHCLKDLVEQTLEPEIVVVCQEGSPEQLTATQFANRGFVTIVSTLDIPTVYEAWNLGIKAASGKYITNANTDDRHDPDAYKIMTTVLEANPDIDLVYHNSYITWKPNQTVEKFVKDAKGTLVTGRHVNEPGIFIWGEYSKARLGHGCFIGPQPMWRADLHQKHGYFNGSLKSAGDYDFWLRIAKADNMQHINLPLGLYQARIDGVEMGDPETNMKEAHDAILLHANREGIVIHGAGEAIRISLGDEYAFVDKDSFKKTVEQI